MENLIGKMDIPLRVLMIMINFIEKQSEEEWNLFQPQTRKGAKKLQAILFVMRKTIKYLIHIHKQCSRVIQEELSAKNYEQNNRLE